MNNHLLPAIDLMQERMLAYMQMQSGDGDTDEATQQKIAFFLQHDIPQVKGLSTFLSEKHRECKARCAQKILAHFGKRVEEMTRVFVKFLMTDEAMTKKELNELACNAEDVFQVTYRGNLRLANNDQANFLHLREALSREFKTKGTWNGKEF